MAAILSLQNRWEIFNIEDEGGIDPKSPITESAKMKSITIVDDEDEDTGTWQQVDNARSRRRRRTRKWRQKSKEIRSIVEELPSDVLSLIFRKLEPLEILSGAQMVCSSWRKASKEPYLFRCIDLRNYWKSFQTRKFVKMVMTAVDRSCGELEEFFIADYFGKDLLNYVLEKSNSIKRLRFVKCFELDDDLLLKFVRKFSDLEELELSYCCVTVKAIAELVGRFCSNLTCFRWVHRTADVYPHSDNQDAILIAKNMPKLRLLQLTSDISDEGLQAILNGCSNLEYLDLRRCDVINLTGETWQNCVEKISHLRHPHESIDDWDYALKRCHEYDLNCCTCRNRCSAFYYYDPDVKEKKKYWEDYDFDADEDFENQIFLPPKSLTCYQ